MEIYLDFEPMGIPLADGNMANLFLVTKKALTNFLQSLKEDIEKENGYFVIRFTPKICELMIVNFSDYLRPLLSIALKDFNIEKIYNEFIGQTNN